MNVFELTRALVDIESITNNEERVGNYLYDYLEPLAARFDGHLERIEVEPRRFNLFAQWGEALKVTLSTHMDTVPPYIASREDGVRLHALLGLVLGVGYLVKAVMLPIAVVFLGVAARLAGGLRIAAARTLLSTLIVAVFVTPFGAALSLTQGRVTLGDSGKLNYAWLVNREPFPFEQPSAPTIALRGGMAWPPALVHPPRILLDRPLVLEFATPAGGTIPLLDDLAYWYEGMTPRFSFADQTRATLASASAYVRICERLGWLIGALWLLWYLTPRRHRRGLSTAGTVVLAPALCALGIYGFVWVEPRYVAAFVVLGVIGALLGVRVADGAEPQRALRAITIVTAVLTLGPLGVSAMRATATECRSPRGAHWETAEALRRLGVRPGDRIAAIGRFEEFAWARLARVQIVAGIDTDAPLYWEAEPAARQRANAALARSGATLIVASRPPGSLDEKDQWTRLGSTTYYVHTF